MVTAPGECVGNTGRKRAHVFAWETINGPMPEGMLGCHTCDNPPCCNPAHVFPGTQQDNVDDMVSKDRMVTGNRRLREEQVIEIRAKFVPYVYTKLMLADEYGVSFSCIDKILSSKRTLWRDLAPEQPIRRRKVRDR